MKVHGYASRNAPTATATAIASPPESVIQIPPIASMTSHHLGNLGIKRFGHGLTKWLTKRYAGMDWPLDIRFLSGEEIAEMMRCHWLRPPEPNRTLNDELPHCSIVNFLRWIPCLETERGCQRRQRGLGGDTPWCRMVLAHVSTIGAYAVGLI